MNDVTRTSKKCDIAERLRTIARGVSTPIAVRIAQIESIADEIDASSGHEPAPEWRPIETAPKDGTMILTVVMGYQPGIYKWFEFEDGGGRWTPDPECFLEEAHFREWIDGNSYDPTHWMPVPKGPTTTKSGDA